MNIYHYTNVAALTNIISKEGIKFRFTHYMYLNDRSEGSNIKGVYDEAVTQLAYDDELSDSLKSELLKVDFDDRNLFVSTESTDDLPLTRITQAADDIYMCCFSQEADSLSMWRYYSKEETGVCLELFDFLVKDNWRIHSEDPSEEHIGKFELKPVIYDDEEKIDIIKTLIHKTLSILNGSETEIAKAIKTRMVQEDYRFLFKDKCFKDENEVRGILHIPSGTLKHNKKSFEIKYRIQHGVMVPYLERKLGLNSLTAVKVSPTASSLAYESVKRYIYDCVGDTVEVTQSKLPLRF